MLFDAAMRRMTTWEGRMVWLSQRHAYMVLTLACLIPLVLIKPASAAASDFDCLKWKPGASEGSVVQPNWTRTQASSRITSYQSSRKNVAGATVQRQVIFVDGRLAMSIVKAYPSQKNVEAVMGAMFDKIFRIYGNAEKGVNGNIQWWPSDGWSVISGLEKDGAIIASSTSRKDAAVVLSSIGSGLIVLLY